VYTVPIDMPHHWREDRFADESEGPIEIRLPTARSADIFISCPEGRW
jgi:hypothetical protein